MRHFAGFFLIVLVVLIMLSNLDLRTVAGIPPSHMLSVPYHDEGESLSVNQAIGWCGVASVQMVLEYISGKAVSQPTLAAELGTNYDSGTYLWKMVNDFHNRGYSQASQAQGSLDGLKQLNWEGYASIISIWFDSKRDAAHAVVVTGYNETGIMVNDPYSLRWDQSVNRTTGPNAFISNSMLANLWTVSSESVIIVPYPAYTSSSTSTTTSTVMGQNQWVKFSGNPIISPEKWDAGGPLRPRVLYDGQTYRMWYMGMDMKYNPVGIGYATSTDGM